ncbi:hypothetical protein IE53DRAFT_387042 [Violaceomyces palustris]|uniref:Uncharacterized protein n=1 Tax=Violaceomyces palustris TaxID=1673888 RepID=A0ACD0NXS0_9BASI|nr:hypothetical protein IE53DRAFT_387042 [Violaceomyces palustris]
MSLTSRLSDKLLEEFEAQQSRESQTLKLEYPHPHPFAGAGPGPFAGASQDAPNLENFHLKVGETGTIGSGGLMNQKHSSSQFSEIGETQQPGPSHNGGALQTTHISRFNGTEFNLYDYPAGWGSQSEPVLTQDTASRLATLQAKLNQRLGPEYLSQRPGPGGGKKLTYVEGWKLVDLANEVFGFNGWSTRIVKMDVDYLDVSPDGSRCNAGVSCIVRVTLRDGAFHEDLGYGHSENAKGKHAALEKCKKEAVTDATKRALKSFGKLLGNCTYDHQYTNNALKVPIPTPKFDPSRLHRRSEFQTVPAPVLSPAAINPPVLGSESSALSGPAPPAVGEPMGPPAQVPKRSKTAPPVPPPKNASPTMMTEETHHEEPPTIRRGDQTEAQAKLAAARLERSQKAQAAYKKKQIDLQQEKSNQGDSTPAAALRRANTCNVQTDSSRVGPSATAAAAIDGRPCVAARSTPRPDTAEMLASLDDESMNEVLDFYDETDTADAEAQSMALELEENFSNGDDDLPDDLLYGLDPGYMEAANDSGIGLVDSRKDERIQVKKEKVATSHVVAVEAVKGNGHRTSERPRRAAAAAAAALSNQVAPSNPQVRRSSSVGRFLRPDDISDCQEAKLSSCPATREKGGDILPVAIGKPVGHGFVSTSGVKRRMENEIVPSTSPDRPRRHQAQANSHHRQHVHREPLSPLAVDAQGNVKRHREG